MQPKLEDVLKDANLTEAQIDQIASIMGDRLSAVRSAHIEEVTAIEQNKDQAIAGLMRELVDKNRLLSEANEKLVAVQPPAKTEPGAVVTATLDEALGIRDGNFKAALVGEDLVFESTDHAGVARKVLIPLAGTTDLSECVLDLPTQQQLDEKVVTKARRIVASNGTSAVGIDLDADGTLAFTVTDAEGSSLFELSRPDSEAVKGWFQTLQEAVDKAKAATDDAKTDDQKADELEESIRAKVVGEVNTLLAEALRPYVPLMRRARDHERMTNLVESLQTAFGTVLGQTVVDATSATQLAALEESNKSLEGEVLRLRQQAIFNERTAGMAQTTRERVQMIVEAAHPASIQDFTDLLEVAVTSIKPAQEPAPAPAKTDPAEGSNSLVSAVVGKL